MLMEIAIPVAVFTILVLALSGFVLLARARLEPSGPVEIRVNDQRTLTVEAGRKLLWTLAAQGIYLPAACGGRGACGQCRVKIHSETRLPAAIESAHISGEEARQGVRLACLLKVRESMRITVPQSVLAVRKWSCEVIASEHIATHIKHLEMRLPGRESIAFDAGAYVLLEAPAYRLSFREIEVAPRFHDDWSAHGLFDLQSVVNEPTVRAYSLANPPQRDDRIELVVRLATPPATAPPDTPPGKVSSFIFSLRPGDQVTLTGPFGDFRARDGSREMLFIAGGVGIAPLRSIIFDQLARGTERKMGLWFGARSRNDLCFFDEFSRAAAQHANFDFQVALSAPRESDHWTGPTGFIHTAVYEHYLGNHPAPLEVEYYLCGPPVMSAAVVEMLGRLGVSREHIFFDDFGE